MTATGNATFSPLTSGTESRAQGYLAAARYLFLGVKALSMASREVAPACALLAGQSLECALKSFLSRNNFSEPQLRSIGHNLEDLWKASSTLGWGLSVSPPAWCVILNQTYSRPFHVRYPLEINAFQTPELEAMAVELGALLAHIETPV